MRVGWLSALALSAGLCSISMADITGKVTLKGNPPEMKEIAAVKQVPSCAAMHKDGLFEETVLVGDKGELQNVVVSIKAPQGKELKGGKPAPAVLDQKGCMYVPHVVAIEVGEPLLVKNSDAFLHNVHTMAIDNDATNFGMPNVGQKKLAGFKTPETITVKCDVHPWMTAKIRVLDNPFFATTDEKGTYKIDTTGLPDGEYELVAWQEKYGEMTKKVTVKGGKAEGDFTFDAAGNPKAEAPAAGKAKAEAPAAHDVTLASLLAQSGEKCDDGSCCAAKTAPKTTSVTKVDAK